MNPLFQRAVKTGVKLRFAVCGPSGCGKTYTLLKLATELGGPIAFIDTERGSASKYADLFEFDVLELQAFDPMHLIRIIGEAGKAGYRVLCIDSLSHFWMGKDGELDKVDRITKSATNSFAAWRQVTPIHNALIEAIVGAPLHVLASMRSKTEWILEREEKTGKTIPRKVGLAPVMRDGIEYEFDVCAEMDQENTLVVTKTRCPVLAGAVFQKPGAEFATALKQWLVAEPAPNGHQAAGPAVENEESSRNAQSRVPSPSREAETDSVAPEVLSMWKRMCKPRQISAEFERLRAEVLEVGGAPGLAEYNQVLRESGVQRPEEFRTSQSARVCARRVFDLIATLRANRPAAASPLSAAGTAEASHGD